MPRCKWTQEDDVLLREAVAEHGPRNWKKIADLLRIRGNVLRSDVQCSQRWLKVLQPGLKKGAWQPEEDQKLRHLVLRARDAAAGASTLDAIAKGPAKLDWVQIAKQIDGRTSKSVRERWLRYLDPDIKKAAWTPDEDALLVSLEARMGHKWAAMARMDGLLGRTGEAVKMRWKQLQKERARANGTAPPPPARPSASASAPPSRKRPAPGGPLSDQLRMVPAFPVQSAMATAMPTIPVGMPVSTTAFLAPPPAAAAVVKSEFDDMRAHKRPCLAVTSASATSSTTMTAPLPTSAQNTQTHTQTHTQTPIQAAKRQVHLSATHRDPPTPGTLSAEAILDDWIRTADDLTAVCPAVDDDPSSLGSSWDEIEKTVQSLAESGGGGGHARGHAGSTRSRFTKMLVGVGAASTGTTTATPRTAARRDLRIVVGTENTPRAISSGTGASVAPGPLVPRGPDSSKENHHGSFRAGGGKELGNSKQLHPQPQQPQLQGKPKELARADSAVQACAVLTEIGDLLESGGMDTPSMAAALASTSASASGRAALSRTSSLRLSELLAP